DMGGRPLRRQHAAHFGHQVENVGILFDDFLLHHRDAAVARDTPDIVSRQVDQHQVLGTLLFVEPQLRTHPGIFGSGSGFLPGAGHPRVERVSPATPPPRSPPQPEAPPSRTRPASPRNPHIPSRARDWLRANAGRPAREPPRAATAPPPPNSPGRYRPPRGSLA